MNILAKKSVQIKKVLIANVKTKLLQCYCLSKRPANNQILSCHNYLSIKYALLRITLIAVTFKRAFLDQ